MGEHKSGKLMLSGCAQNEESTSEFRVVYV